MRLLNHGLVHSAISNNLRSLDGLIVNVGFNSVLRNIFDLSLVSVLGNIFGNVFHLLVISVTFLNGLIIGLVYGLIFGNSFGNGDIFSDCLSNVFSYLTFIRNLMLGDHWFIVSVGLLNWNILNMGLSLRLWLSINDVLHRLLVRNILRLDHGWLNDRLNQRLLILRLRDVRNGTSDNRLLDHRLLN